MPELSPIHHPLYQLKRTPFHARTSELCLPHNWRRWGGCLAVGSYDLGLDREYWAIRNHAALIDVSPLMKYRIEGPDAARLLHRLTPRDIHKLSIGQVYYTGWCDEDGKLVDDGTVTRIAEQEFRLTAAEPQLRWLTMNAVGMQVRITETTEQVAALSLQGPKSRTILNRCCGSPVDGLKYFRMGPNTIAGRAVTVSRTGYTGDLGYEIWIETADALAIWDTLMDRGHDFGITPCGILAMDMARVEAGLFMLDVDYTPAHHAWVPGQTSSPYEMGLGWTVNLDKSGYFVGRRALEREHRDGPAWKFVGVEVEWESLERAYAAAGLPPQIPAMAVRGSLPVYKAGRQVGYASTSTWSPVLKKYIALVHLQRPYYEPGTSVNLEVTVEHHRRQAAARVVALPFYEPEWKKA
ncbi:MAG TPA: aminomethyltransferase family protein [Steroidobacteraceae bacterium]|nr:aminomethyltransferase family protein [Steroidobacteraceae bacterium]